VSIASKEEKGSACSKAIKGTPIEEASMPCKGRSTGKKVEKGRRRGASMHG